jgi:hypothetical protein
VAWDFFLAKFIVTIQCRRVTFDNRDFRSLSGFRWAFPSGVTPSPGGGTEVSQENYNDSQ